MAAQITDDDVATIAAYLNITEKQVAAVLWLHDRFLRERAAPVVTPQAGDKK